MRDFLYKGLFLGLVVMIAACTVTPSPYSGADIEDIAKIDLELIYKSQEPVEGALDLYQAMARSLKYNLDNRVKLIEEAVANRNFDLAKTDMLPMMAASAGYLDRTNVDASRSVSILSGNESLEPSTSQDQERTHADIRFTWNLLDFGVSYLQAKQDADRFIMAQKTRQKVMLKMLQQVRSSYWRSVAMGSMTSELDIIAEKVDRALANLEKVREEQLRTPVAILNDIRLLIETRQQLTQIRQSINLSQIQLATLVNEPTSKKLAVEVPATFAKPPLISSNIDEMELYALSHSADYVNQVYNARIDQIESRKSLLRLLPGLEFSYGHNYDSNSFLWNEQWGEAGIRLTGDIMQLFYSDKIKAYGKAKERLAQTRRMAINMAVVAGVHLSWQDYRNALDRLDHAQLLDQIDQEISAYSSNAAANKAGSGVEAIQNEFRAFRSKMERLLSYAETQGSYGAFLVSMGVNPIPSNYQVLSVDELASVLKQQFKDWETQMIDQQSAQLFESPQQRETLPLESNEEMALRFTLNDWSEAWEQKESGRYFSFYVEDYRGEKFSNHLEWKTHRNRYLIARNNIDIEFNKFEIIELEKDRATVKLSMQYFSDEYSDRTEKLLSLKKIESRWFIQEENNLLVIPI